MICWSRVRDSLLPHSNILGQDMNPVHPAMLSVKRSATCSTRGGSQEMYITFASAMRIRQNPLWLWNPEETSPEIQNRGTSGPKIGHVNVSDKKTLKKKKKKMMAQHHHQHVHSLGLESNPGRIHRNVSRYHCAIRYVSLKNWGKKGTG